jgi:hypothetical protein
VRFLGGDAGIVVECGRWVDRGCEEVAKRLVEFER